jgi:hypothetical protein
LRRVSVICKREREREREREEEREGEREGKSERKGKKIVLLTSVVHRYHFRD